MSKHLFSLAVALVLFTDCTKDPVSPQLAEIPQGETWATTYPYLALQDTIVLINFDCVCHGSILQQTLANIQIPYRLEGNRLRLMVRHARNIDSAGTDLFIYYEMTRASGQGLKGEWVLDSIHVESTRPLGAQDSALVKKESSIISGNRLSWITISQTEFILRNLPRSSTFVGDFRTKWQNYLDTVSAIALDSASPRQLRLIGTISGDTVTVTQDDQLNITYVSNDSRYSEHTYWNDKTRCPNTEFPDWIGSFLNENRYPIVLKSPARGDQLFVGDTITFRWAADTLYRHQMIGTLVEATLDDGFTWFVLTSVDSPDFAPIVKGHEAWGAARFVIPEILSSPGIIDPATNRPAEFALVGKEVAFRLNDYAGALYVYVTPYQLTIRARQ